jgi:formyl-CoA transferase
MLPLEGIRVLALEQYYAGNIGSLILRRFGAEVIKVELPGEGDAMRHIGPRDTGPDGRSRSLSELRVMLGKKSVAVDMAKPEGKEIVLSLAAKSDVVWSNMKPSSLRKLGFTFEAFKERNPEIVYTTLSGFGHDDVAPDGPMGDWVAFDIIAQGLAGLLFRTESESDEPRYNGIALGDQVTALQAVIGTVMALYKRQRDGGAQRVDVAMHDAMLQLNELSLAFTGWTGKPPSRGRSSTSSPYGAFRSKDGFVNIAVGGTPVWRRFAKAMGRPDLVDDPRFKEARSRVANNAELEGIVTEWSLARTTDEIVAVLHAGGVPSAPVYSLPQVLESPQLAPRHMLYEVEDAAIGKRRVLGNPIKMASVPDEPLGDAPDVARDTASVLANLLGMDEARIEELAQSGVIGLGEDA